MQPRHRRLPAQFEDLQFSHHGVSLGLLGKPDEAIGDGEHRVVSHLVRDVFADQKRRGLPTGEKLCKALDEYLHLLFARAGHRFAHHRAKRIHHHHRRTERGDLLDDFCEHRVQILFHHHIAEVDEANGLAQLRFVEEGILLLIAQHLYRRFAQHGEIKRRFSDGRVGEYDLMRQRGFATPRCARDDVEGKFREAATQDLVEAAHAGRQCANRDFSPMSHDLFANVSFGSSASRVFRFHFHLQY